MKLGLGGAAQQAKACRAGSTGSHQRFRKLREELEAKSLRRRRTKTNQQVKLALIAVSEVVGGWVMSFAVPAQARAKMAQFATTTLASTSMTTTAS